MSQLFKSLYAYRQRENRDPLEDWLTECLAVTIRALPKCALESLLAEWCNAEPPKPGSFLKDRTVTIHTQYTAGTAGRPDMLVKLDGQPWIVIENKVGHSVSERVNNNGITSHQLLDYARWLNEHSTDCALRPAVVFVTHLTPPPEDFTHPTLPDLYFGFTKHSTSWGALARRLMSLTGALDENHYARVLAQGFDEYLEDQNMSDEFPDSSTFAAAELYLAKANTLENLISRMWEQWANVASSKGLQSRTLEAQTEYGAVSAWRYIRGGPASTSGWSYLECGIWFPELGQWYGEDEIGCEVRGPQVYAGLFNEEVDFDQTTEIPEGFIRPDTNFVTLKPISDFPSDPQKRGEQIIDWLSDHARRLRPFLIDHGIVPNI